MEECPDALTVNYDNKTVHVKNEATIWQYDVGTLWKIITNPLN